MTTGRVFISSTCYDLLDLRAEVEAELRAGGLQPVLSDRPTSEFILEPYRDTIETCLANLRSSEAVVLVLSQRYGARLGKLGYADISATHLEYRAALDAKKRLFVYVRDRLAGEYETWKRSTDRKSLQLAWVQDPLVFELLQEHENRPVINGEPTNWYWPFQSSRDLCARLSIDLAFISHPALLRLALEQGRLPQILVVYNHYNRSGTDEVSFRFLIQNSGTVPIADVQLRLNSGPPARFPGLRPGAESTERVIKEIFPRSIPKYSGTLFLTYTIQNGMRIQDEWHFEAEHERATAPKLERKRLLSTAPFELL